MCVRQPARLLFSRFQTLLCLALVSFTFAWSSPRAAAQSSNQQLTIDRIFNSNEFGAHGGWNGRWNGPETYIAFERSASIQGDDLVQYNANGTGRKVLVTADALIPKGTTTPLGINNYELSADGRELLVFSNAQRVWRQWNRGDYWVLNVATHSLHKLGGNAAPASLLYARFSPDGKRVAYVRDNNLFVEEPETGHIWPLTRDGSHHIINGTSDWVYEEELDLREAWSWSPDSKSIAFWQFDTTGVPEYTLVNNTDSLYPAVKTFPYPKTGQTNSTVKVGIVGATGAHLRWIKLPGDPRNNYIARLNWTPSSDGVLIQQLNRLQNHNTFYLAAARDSSVKSVLTDEDKAWVDAYIDFIPGNVHWLNSGHSFAFVSERSGWRHIYIGNLDGSPPRAVTSGAFDVIHVDSFDEKRQKVYFAASPQNATQSYLYAINLDGSGAPERITPESETGTNHYVLSPGADYAMHQLSSFGVPPTVEMIHLPDRAVIRTFTDNHELRAKLATIATGQHEFIHVPMADGVKLDGWIIKPPNFEPTKRYPVLFYVYGEPAGTTVHDAWEGAHYLWYLMLAQRGYIIASVDNRGTDAPRGSVWRKSVYRKIGVLASADQAAAATWMDSLPYIDPGRIGIWGWSGGGTMSLNAIFRYPNIYRTAMSVAPVPDMHLYDSIYQERYMGLPQENEEDYRQGSPITFASQLRGNLLLVHGTGDDNVHFQGTERLINALIAANKPFSMMAYPNRSHGIFEGENTTRHLYELLTRYLLANLPPGPTSGITRSAP